MTLPAVQLPPRGRSSPAKPRAENFKWGSAVLFNPKSTLLTLPRYELQTPLTAASVALSLRSLSVIKFYDKASTSKTRARDLNAFFVILLFRGKCHQPGASHVSHTPAACSCPWALQYSCLENPMDRGAWQVTVHWVAKSWT